MPELPQSIGFRRGMESFPAFALDAQRVAVAKDFHAHLAKGANRARVVVAAGKIENPASPMGDAAEDYRAVGDRFVPGHGDIARERLFDRFDAFH